MNTTEAMVNGLRFAPDCDPQVIGHSKFASMIAHVPTGSMLFNHDEDEPIVTRMERDDELDDE